MPPAIYRYPVSRFLTSDGTSTGTRNANGNYSGAVTQFWVTPANADTLVISRILIEIKDSTGFSADEYGNLGAALTNGIALKIMAEGGSTVISDLMDGDVVKTNAGWGSFCYDVDLKTWGVGDEVLLVRWTFAKSGVPITLDAGQRLSVFLNDDLTGLVTHSFLAQGYYLNKGM